MKILLFLLAILNTSCNESGTNRADEEPAIFIGDSPKDMTAFASTDCVRNLSDCSAKDAEGRQYVFFDGVLSQISIDRANARPDVLLPAEMVFGEDIEASRDKASNAYQIDFDRGEINGVTVYSSDFLIRAPSGVRYSIELISDESNRLKKIVQRTDF